MSVISIFQPESFRGRPRCRIGGTEVVERFTDLGPEYASLDNGPALVDRSYRGLLEVTGKDRQAWLHNLTTNQVKTLAPGDGNYAFALNVKGRILFDLNILARNDHLLLDIDGAFLPAALKHLNKYIIMEDVRLVDRSADFVRLGLSGTGAAMLLEEYGVSNARNLPQFGPAAVRVAETNIPLVRHDFCGAPGFELLAPASAAVEVWRMLTTEGKTIRAIPVGAEAVEIRRIEAGIPWPGREISEEYVPAETGQLARAVSFNKGCYLGQEVVERMHSRQVVSRLLVGLEFDEPLVPPAGANLLAEDEKPIGQVTSSCRSMALGKAIGLGYVRTASSAPGTALGVRWEGGCTTAKVAALPFFGAGAHSPATIMVSH